MGSATIQAKDKVCCMQGRGLVAVGGVDGWALLPPAWCVFSPNGWFVKLLLMIY